MRTLRMIAALLLAAPLALSPALAQAQAPSATAPAREIPGRQPDLVLTGEVTGQDHEHYRRLPFTVPAGTERLVVEFDYTGRDQRTVIDLGVADPEGPRGWSGGDRASFTIARYDATPGYRPGPLAAGGWNVLLGMPNVRPASRSPYTARIWFIAQDRVDTLPDVTAGRGPGWYRGDLHLHTGHSDGKCQAQSGRRAPCPLASTVDAAAARGLDFISITDHNTLAHLQPLREAQAGHDRLLLIPGVEITTFIGHANAIGVTQLPDFTRIVEQPDGLAQLATEIHQRGGLLSINHPGLPSGEECMGCGWTLPDAAMPLVDAVEVANGGSMAAAGGRFDTPVSGMAFWTRQLASGRRLTAVGGSDNHNAPQSPGSAGAVGRPTTVVWAQDLTRPAIIAGLLSGRVFIDLEGSADRMIDLTVSAPGGQAQMGGTLSARRGDRLSVHLSTVAAPQGARLELWDAGTQVPLATPAGSASAETQLRLAPGRHALRPVLRAATGDLLLIGNPVQVQVR